MGLFKKSYVERIKDISERLEGISLNEDDLILNFSSKISKIEEYDIEFIRLIQRLSREGHLSEKMKRVLLNQLVFLLRRLEKLKFEDHDKLKEIEAEVETILKFELTAERIGIEFNGNLYHGTNEIGIRKFKRIKWGETVMDPTLGLGNYFTDNKRMAINYGFYRGGTRENVRFSVYIVRAKKGRNYIADLNDPLKIRAIYIDILKYLERISQNGMHEEVKLRLNNFIEFLKWVAQNNYTFINIRELLVPQNHPAFEKWKTYRMNNIYIMGHIRDFLESVGYHGLRCAEKGEGLEAIYPWVKSTSYVIFNPDDLEIIAEEHFIFKNGKVILTK